MSLKIEILPPSDKIIIEFIKTRLARRWKMKPSQIQKKIIDPALANSDLPLFFVAKVDDEFAGKIFLFIRQKGYLGIDGQPWINALWVEEKFRGAGIGQKLIEKAKQKVKEMGYKSLFLETADAAPYYQKIGGWEKIGTDFWPAGNREVVILKSSTNPQLGKS